MGSSNVDGGELGTDQTGQDTNTLSKTEIFDILSASRRQEVLRYLHKQDEEADIGDIAEHIASLECDCKRRELTSEQRKRTYVGLYQCHLPKMDDAGVIDYDSDRGTIGLNDRSYRLLNYMYFEEDESTEDNSGFLGRLLR